jgi:hypothetical protein
LFILFTQPDIRGSDALEDVVKLSLGNVKHLGLGASNVPYTNKDVGTHGLASRQNMISLTMDLDIA